MEQAEDTEFDNSIPEKENYTISRNILMRNYQIELIERAKKENIIVYLPTGTGKTLIAIHVLCSFSSSLKKDFDSGGKRAFFIATTKVMVHQLARNLSHHTKFKIGIYTGEMNVDIWCRQKWLTEFQRIQVLIMTADILKQILQLNFIQFHQINLIVFDECHHAVFEHPYRSILLMYKDAQGPEAPLILGLSAVLLNSSPKGKAASQIIGSLEDTFCGKVATHPLLQEIMIFAAHPTEKEIIYKTDKCPAVFKKVNEIVEEVINCSGLLHLIPKTSPEIPDEGKDFKNKNQGKLLKKYFSNFKIHLSEMGSYCGSLSALFYIIVLEKERLMSSDSASIDSLVYGRTQFNKIRCVLLKKIGEESGASIVENSSHKVQTLIKIILDIRQIYNRNNFSMLIFVKQRATAIILAYMLKRLSSLDQSFAFIKADFAIGNCSFSKASVFSGLKTEEILKKFSDGSLNILTCTNVLEEGLDVPSCNCVINFDFPLAYTGYIQSKGRARDKSSLYYLFVSEEEKDKKLKLLQEYRALDKQIYEIVLQEPKSLETDEEIEREDKLEKLTILGTSDTIVLDMSIAIKAVYRYCSSLPQDKFSFLYPASWYKKLGCEQIQGFVQLPNNCPIREVIEGEVKTSIRLAKKSAFLNTIRKLYDEGEVNRDLSPKSPGAIQQDYEYLFPHFKHEKIDEKLPMPGTSKRKQVYKLEFAECLTSCLPLPKVKAYLHLLDFTVDFEKPELERKVILYDLLRTPTTFAILSSKKLAKICRFPLFLDMGQIKCDLLVNYDEVLLNQSELEEIKLCHFALFNKVTKTLKKCQVFDNRNKEHSFFIVPMKKGVDDRFVLNWDLIRSDFCQNNRSAIVRYNPFQRGIQRTSEEFQEMSNFFAVGSSDALVLTHRVVGRLLLDGPKFTMTETDYKYFVISPSYRRQEPPQCYVVNKFCRDMSPLSRFPRACFQDYFTYYKEKYDIDITNLDQPLLKAAPVYRCSNFNSPGGGLGPRGRKWKVEYAISRDKSKEYEEHLIPELCDVIPFDNQYWLKALLLPSALSRITHLFCVDEFRRKIVAETSLGIADISTDENWKPLEIDVKCLEEQEEEPRLVNLTNLKMFLPLSKLKDRAKMQVPTLLDPERNLYDISVCDLKDFVQSIEKVDWEEETSSFSLQQDNFEILRLISLQNLAAPDLSVFKQPDNQKGPELADLLQACTSRSANDMVNYERLEILGDSFLKLATSVFLFRNFPENEGVLTTIKGKLVGNRNLLYCGTSKNIQSIINVTDFVPFDWNPPLLCIPERLVAGIVADNVDPAVINNFEIPSEEQLSGNLSENTFAKNEEILRGHDKNFQIPSFSLLPYKYLSDKTVSDCVEAFLGVYLRALGLSGAFDLLKWFGLLPKENSSYEDVMVKPYGIELLGTGGETVVMNLLNEVFYADLEKTLGYYFKNKALLLEAISHPSYSRNRITNCYQRLEFLGDAILDFLITTYVYDNCGNLKPGDVTDIRSALVNNVTFACLTVRYDLHKYLLSCSSVLNKVIQNFVNFQASRKHVVDENVMFLMEESDSLIAEAIQVPKALSDLFESLAGAIFLDSGNSLEVVWRIYYKMMKKEIDDFTQNVPKTSVRLLHEICGDRPYFETKIYGDSVKVACTAYYENYEIKTHGFGANKTEGKKCAAKLALKKIMELKK